MTQKTNLNLCNKCNNTLQHEVKYCPFCGNAQRVKQAYRAEQHSTGIKTDHLSKQEQSTFDSNTVIVRHLTHKEKKELMGIIILSSSLEVIKKYDKYAFKKGQGVFLRLRYLHLVPDELLSLQQIELKNQNKSVESSALKKDVDAEKVITEPAVVNPLKAKHQTEDKAEEALKTTVPSEVFVQNVDQSKVTSKQNNPFETVQSQPKIKEQKSSSTLWIIIAFIVLGIVAYGYLSSSQPEDERGSEENAVVAVENDTWTHCEGANSQISRLLLEATPMRANSVVKLYQAECRGNPQFVELVIDVEARLTEAKDKLALAKEHLQDGNLELAQENVLAALALDHEFIAANQLRKMIETKIVEDQSETHEELTPDQISTELKKTVEMMAAHENDQQAYAAAEQIKKHNQQLRQQVEKTQREQLERQQALQQQAQTQLNNKMNKADHALRSENYTQAKALAQEILLNSPDNSQAKGILRQAEQGEANAFNDIGIE